MSAAAANHFPSIAGSVAPRRIGLPLDCSVYCYSGPPRFPPHSTVVESVGQMIVPLTQRPRAQTSSQSTRANCATINHVNRVPILIMFTFIHPNTYRHTSIKARKITTIRNYDVGLPGFHVQLMRSTRCGSRAVRSS